MKLRLALASATAAVALASGAAAADATANASANIVAPVQLTAARDLKFGTIAKPSLGNTVVTVASAITPTATPSVVGGNAFIPTGGLAQAAQFRLTGTASQNYTIASSVLTFASSIGNLADVGAEPPLAVGGSLVGVNGSLSDTGSSDLYIGGHFTISPATTVQTYSGTLVLTVNFN